jgi:hypothetical protein
MFLSCIKSHKKLQEVKYPLLIREVLGEKDDQRVQPGWYLIADQVGFPMKHIFVIIVLENSGDIPFRSRTIQCSSRESLTSGTILPVSIMSGDVFFRCNIL